MPTYDTLTDAQMEARLTGGEHSIDPYQLRSAVLTVRDRLAVLEASRIVTIADATPYAVLAADSRKTHIVADQTSSITINLPTAAAGLWYRFVSKAVAAEGQNWVIVAGAGVFYLGGLTFLDNDAGAGADEVHAGVYPNGSTHITMNVVTPCAGTVVDVFCDGTYWIVQGIINSPTIPTFAT